MSLPFVTLHFPWINTYHEIKVSASECLFEVESYERKEAVSGMIDFKARGIRFSMNLYFDQTVQHDLFRHAMSQMNYHYRVDKVRVYLMALSEIGQQSEYIDILPDSLRSSLSYSDQIRRHSHSMSFVGYVPAIGIGLFYVVDNDGNFIFTNNSTRIVAEVSF